jgi:hypothetical protein
MPIFFKFPHVCFEALGDIHLLVRHHFLCKILRFFSPGGDWIILTTHTCMLTGSNDYVLVFQLAGPMVWKLFLHLMLGETRKIVPQTSMIEHLHDHHVAFMCENSAGMYE